VTFLVSWSPRPASLAITPQGVGSTTELCGVQRLFCAAGPFTIRRVCVCRQFVRKLAPPMMGGAGFAGTDQRTAKPASGNFCVCRFERPPFVCLNNSWHLTHAEKRPISRTGQYRIATIRNASGHIDLVRLAHPPKIRSGCRTGARKRIVDSARLAPSASNCQRPPSGSLRPIQRRSGIAFSR